MQANQPPLASTSRVPKSVQQSMAKASNPPGQLAAGNMASPSNAPRPAVLKHSRPAGGPLLPGQLQPHARPTGTNVGATAQALPYSPMSDQFLIYLRGRTVILKIGPQREHFAVPIGLLAAHSSVLHKIISQQTSKNLNEQAVRDEDSKKRKLSSSDNDAMAGDSGIIGSSEHAIHFQDTRLPMPVLHLPGVELAVFSLFLRFIYQGNYPPIHEGPPVAGQVQGEECHPLSIRAWLFGFHIDAYLFLNHAMVHIYRSIAGGALTITPALFEFVWINTTKEVSVFGKVQANTLRALFLHLLINHWPHKHSTTLYRAGETDSIWMEVIKRHDDLFQYFFRGISEQHQVLPVERYLVCLNQPTAASATSFKPPQKKANVRKPAAATQPSKDDTNTSKPLPKEGLTVATQSHKDVVNTSAPPPKDELIAATSALKDNMHTEPLQKDKPTAVTKIDMNASKPSQKDKLIVVTKSDVSASEPPQENERDSVVQDSESNKTIVSPPPKQDPPATTIPRSIYPSPKTSPLREVLARYGKSKEVIEKPGTATSEAQVEAMDVDDDKAAAVPKNDPVSTAEKVARMSYLRSNIARIEELDKEKAAMAARIASKKDVDDARGGLVNG